MDMITVIKSTGSGNDDVAILMKTKEALREKVLLDIEGCHIMIKVQFTMRYDILL